MRESIKQAVALSAAATASGLLLVAGAPVALAAGGAILFFGAAQFLLPSKREDGALWEGMAVSPKLHAEYQELQALVSAIRTEKNQLRSTQLKGALEAFCVVCDKILVKLRENSDLLLSVSTMSTDLKTLQEKIVKPLLAMEQIGVSSKRIEERMGRAKNAVDQLTQAYEERLVALLDHSNIQLEVGMRILNRFAEQDAEYRRRDSQEALPAPRAERPREERYE